MFLYVEMDGETVIVNSAHIVELRETNQEDHRAGRSPRSTSFIDGLFRLMCQQKASDLHLRSAFRR
jgi:hypothetical protein